MGRYLTPSFLIIGGVKCATSSLYRYLNEHPLVLPCKTKEPGLFASRAWYKVLIRYPAYRKLFPLAGDTPQRIEAEWLDLEPNGTLHSSTFSKQTEPGRNYITGEATAATWLGANPRLVRLLLPDVRLIMLIRNPSQRYLSHIAMYERFEREGRDGYDVGNLEKFIRNEIDQHRLGKRTRVLEHGLYAEHLQRWVATFGDDALLILRASALGESASAAATLDQVTDFLSLPTHKFGPSLDRKYNQAAPQEFPPAAKVLLDEFYAPHNRTFASRHGIQLDDA